MENWCAQISMEAPYWAGVSELLKSFSSGGFPPVEALNHLLTERVTNQRDMPIRFVSSEETPAGSYEEHIYNSGEVSTRVNNWHDLFNALMWMRFPRIKSAMNAAHHAVIEKSNRVGRGKQRDALTLFDECGVVVVADKHQNLEALAKRQWSAVFTGGTTDWDRRYRVLVCGHAMLEKFLSPYKSMTANVLLVQVSESDFALSNEKLSVYLDTLLARKLRSGGLLQSSADLSPLPLMGIPGWWLQDHELELLHRDKSVFRPPPDKFDPAPVFR